MPAHFDWQTEEDSRHNHEPWEEAPQSPPGDRRGRWRVVALIGLLLVAAGAIVWWRVDQRIDATLAAVRTDVIASHNVVQRAAVDGDLEVLRSFLSGRDPAWTAGQLTVFDRGLFANRASFGLTPAEEALPAILPAPQEETAAGAGAAEIELSPDLTEAIVAVDLPYQAGDETTVLLRQTTIYRRGDQRWLLAPPTDEWWGRWTSASGPYLTIFYPERDAEIAQRLVADLNDFVERACANPADLDCSLDLHLSLHFDDSPAALAALETPLGALERAQEEESILRLPTPTLVGLPAGDSNEARESAYAALRDGYARQVLAATVATVVGWRCCENQMLFETLLEYQLSRLGLVEWPVSEADFQRILDERIRLGDLRNAFQSRPGPDNVWEESRWIVRAAVDYLMNSGPPGTPARLLNLSTRPGAFNRLLNTAWADEDEAPPISPETAWWLYAYQGTLSPGEPSVPEPDEDLYLACTTVGDTQRPAPSLFFRFEPESGQWTELHRLDGFIWMTGLPDSRTLMLQEYELASESWQTNIWRDGRRTTAFAPASSNYAISFGQTDPASQNLVTYAVDQEDGLVNTLTVELGDCQDDCASEQLPGQPYWSPSGQHVIFSGDEHTFPTMLLANSDYRYTLVDSSADPGNEALRLGRIGSAAARPIGLGYAPFWVDNATFGFVRQVETDEPGIGRSTDVIITGVDERRQQQVVRSTELMQLLPEEYRLGPLTIGYVAVHPERPGRLFIVALAAPQQRAFVFAHDLAAEHTELLSGATLRYELNHSLGFSPDGRHLVLTGQDFSSLDLNTQGMMILLDIDAGRSVPFMTRLPFFLPSAVYDWTQDGRWLAVALDDNLIGLIAPDENYVRLLPHNYGACTSVAWLER